MTILNSKLQEIQGFLNEVISDAKRLLTPPVLPGEIPIAIDKTEVSAKEAKTWIDSSATFFSIANTNAFHPFVQTIKMEHLTALRNNPLSKPSESAVKWIGGLRLIYAIEASVFKLYFRPLYFKWAKDLFGQGSEAHALYALSEDETVYYDYDANTGFQAIDMNDVAVANKVNANIQRYADAQLGIYIQRRNGDSMKTAHTVNDVKSVIFTFQEFFTLQDSGNPNINEIKIWNYVKQINSSTNPLVKHDLMLSSDDVAYNPNLLGISLDTIKSNFLDLSHLCPPNCGGSDFLFRLYQ